MSYTQHSFSTRPTLNLPSHERQEAELTQEQCSAHAKGCTVHTALEKATASSLLRMFPMFGLIERLSVLQSCHVSTVVSFYISQ